MYTGLHASINHTVIPCSKALCYERPVCTEQHHLYKKAGGKTAQEHVFEHYATIEAMTFATRYNRA